MAFTQDTFAPLSANSSTAPRVWTYSTSDDFATVTTSGYFDTKKFQLEENDLIEAVIQGVKKTLVVGSDTSTATTSNLASLVNFSEDTDTGVYVINTGTPTPIGLSLNVNIPDPNNTDVEVFIRLPNVIGSTGNTSGKFDLVVDGNVAKAASFSIANTTQTYSFSVDALRPIAVSGTVTIAIEVTNAGGDITIDNSQGASMVVKVYDDVEF